MLTLDDLKPNSNWTLPEKDDPKFGKLLEIHVMLHMDECGCWLTSNDTFFKPSDKVSSQDALAYFNEYGAICTD
jgi:hypothetical protein